MTAEQEPDVDQLLRSGFAEAAAQVEQYRARIARLERHQLPQGAPPEPSPEVVELWRSARSHYQVVGRAAWRDTASLDEWADAYRHAQAMRPHDVSAVTAQNRIEEEVRRRFEVDIREAFRRMVLSDPAYQRAHDQQAEVDGPREQARPARARADAPHGTTRPDAAVSAQPAVPDGPTDASEPSKPSPQARPGRNPDLVVVARDTGLAEEASQARAAAWVAGRAFAQPPLDAVRSSLGDQRPTATEATVAGAEALLATDRRRLAIAELLSDELPDGAPASARAIAEDRREVAATAVATAEAALERARELRATREPATGTELAYPDTDTWVRCWLLPVWRRPHEQHWCPKWWLHPEAVARLEALWRAWEHFRHAGATGPATWWREHADYHLAVLSGPHGPFGPCSTRRGHRDHHDPLTVATNPLGVREDGRGAAASG